MNLLTFYGIERKEGKLTFNDYCGGGSERIIFSNNKMYYYRPMEQTPYKINSFSQVDDIFTYKLTSEYGGKDFEYKFRYNIKTGILKIVNIKERFSIFINSKFLSKIEYNRTPCEECYEEENCQEWEEKMER